MIYKSSRYENDNDLKIVIPWDSNTFKGWFGGLIILALIFFFLRIVDIEPVKKREVIRNQTYVLLKFGDGDGTGISSGNLEERGKKVKGEKPKMNIEDAAVQSKDIEKATKTTNNDISSAERFKPVEKLTTVSKTIKNDKGQEKKSVGISDGEEDLIKGGLARFGSGKGAGEGFGDIDWGGGGNRKVLQKTIPEFPDGVTSSSKIVLQFYVLPDGTVSKVVPLRKGDPKLEFAAIKALKKWKFNPIDSSNIMIGEIPLTFILR